MHFNWTAILGVVAALGVSPALAEDAAPPAGPAKTEAPKAGASGPAAERKQPVKKAAARKPAAKKPAPAAPRMIGQVAVVDADAAYVRLDGPWNNGFPQRTWLTSYLPRQGGPHRHLLTLELTHHAEAARNYVKAECAPAADGVTAEDVTIEQRQAPSLQCTRNRGGEQVCFHTEVYTIELPDRLLAERRQDGVALHLTAASAEPLDVKIETKQIDTQMKAVEELEKKPAPAAAPKADKPVKKKAAPKPAATKPTAAQL